MNLDEAIEHAEEKAKGGTPCAEQHRQLALWLRELRAYRHPDVFHLRVQPWARDRFLRVVAAYHGWDLLGEDLSEAR